MTSSSNEDGRDIWLSRVASLRDFALQVLDQHGVWKDVEGFPGKLQMFEKEPLMLIYRTPFQPIPISQEAVLAGISAHEQRRVARDFGLDIWESRRKVLSLMWNQTGPVAVLLYRPGVWEHVLSSEILIESAG